MQKCRGDERPVSTSGWRASESGGGTHRGLDPSVERRLKIKKSNMKSLTNPISDADEEMENLMAKKTSAIEEPQRRSFEW